MGEGFFNADAFTIVRGDEVKKSGIYSAKVLGCRDCGLFERCEHPRLPVWGFGRRGILFVGEYPGKDEDVAGRAFVGAPARFLTTFLSSLGLVAERDCWFTYALRCRVPRGGEATVRQLQACRRKLHEEVSRLAPRAIVCVGDMALKALIGDRLNSRVAPNLFRHWFGEAIPDQELRAWVIPVENPNAFIQREITDPYAESQPELSVWRKSLSRLLELIDCEVPDYAGRSKEAVRCLYSPAEAIRAMEKMLVLGERSPLAYDYETTGLRPYRPGQRILSASISDGKRSYAFPFFAEDPKFMALWREFLTRPEIGKIAHNASFEDVWSREVCGVWPHPVVGDPMLAAHCRHNLKPTNLKFQTYTAFGILGYDTEADEYMGAEKAESDAWGANALNRLHLLPLEKLLRYNAEDSLYTHWLHQRPLPPEMQEGYEFLLQGDRAFSRATHLGVRVDTERLALLEAEMSRRIDEALSAMREAPEMRAWDRVKPFNPNSSEDIQHLFYRRLGFPVVKVTNPVRDEGDADNPSTDVEALRKMDSPLARTIIEYRRWVKARDTYLGQFKSHQSGGVIHASFNLGRVRTYRTSCIAKDTKIMVNRGYDGDRMGVPIQDIVPGDYVYCFNDELKPVLRKVLWAGFTGHKKVVRVHFRGHAGRPGFVDMTPEHRVRLVSGEYVEAQALFSEGVVGKYGRYPRVLSIHREDSGRFHRVWATGGAEFLEHRFVYEQISGTDIRDGEVIHHRNGNHSDHEYANLEKMTAEEHSRLHCKDTVLREDVRARNIEAVKIAHEEGRYVYVTGEENRLYLPISKTDCIRSLVRARGKLTGVPYDFERLKRELEKHGLDFKYIALRYNKEGMYLSKNKIIHSLKEYGFSGSLKVLHIGYYTLKKLCEMYHIGYDRAYSNQFGMVHDKTVTENNHVVVKIEYLDEEVDVYDIEVEGEHNFIANELCVHNSSSPNLQNIPSRDALIKKQVRSIIIPRPGNFFCGYDYKGVEVSVAASYSQDPALIAYVSDPNLDMHRDCAMQLFLLPQEGVKKAWRHISKNKFVFAEFYGDWYRQIAENIWEAVCEDAELRAHLASKGLKTLKQYTEHVRDVEYDFWNKRFPGYKAWRDEQAAFYQKHGYLHGKTGFFYQTPMRKNEIKNYQGQGSAAHILVWSYINIERELREVEGTDLIGQIHDQFLVDARPEHEALVDRLVYEYGTQKVREHWPWITVPLMVEKERGAVDAPWSTMEGCGYLGRVS